MKLKSLLFSVCLSMVSSVYAINQHIHPNDGPIEKSPTDKSMTWPGYCEIEIINRSYQDIYVSGEFDDGYILDPFTIYSFEGPHYVSLYYYGYCHVGMYLYISTHEGYLLYSGYTKRRSSIRVLPYYGNQMKVEVSAKE